MEEGNGGLMGWELEYSVHLEAEKQLVLKPHSLMLQRGTMSGEQRMGI